MSGLIYLVGAVLLAATGLGLLWLLENAPFRDSLRGVDDFERARRALRRRHRPGIWRAGTDEALRSDKREGSDSRQAPSTVKILR